MLLSTVTMFFSLLRGVSLSLDIGLAAVLFSFRTFTTASVPCWHSVCDHGDLAVDCRILPTASRLQIPCVAEESMRN